MIFNYHAAGIGAPLVQRKLDEPYLTAKCEKPGRDRMGAGRPILIQKHLCKADSNGLFFEKAGRVYHFQLYFLFQGQ